MRVRGVDFTRNAPNRVRMTASRHPPNQPLQLLDAADCTLLRRRLAGIKMVRETVLDDADVLSRHVYFPHRGTVCIQPRHGWRAVRHHTLYPPPDRNRRTCARSNDVMRLLFSREGPSCADAGNSAVTRTSCTSGAHGAPGAIIPEGHLVPIANISRREDDGTCACRERFRLAWLADTETGGSFGNDGASSQRFPVRAVGR